MANVLILGASYGSLLAIKLLMAGNRVTLVCTPPTAELINREGIVVKFPIRGREGLVTVASRDLPGARRGNEGADADADAAPALRAASPAALLGADGGGAQALAPFDLAVLGMQELQYAEPEMARLMSALAAAKVPCLAIMNMPPLAYLKRIPAADAGAAAVRRCFAGGGAVWDAFDPSLVTLASPDPQAFRPPGEPKNALQVGLPTNFKAAAFEREEHTALLRRLEEGILGARLRVRKEKRQQEDGQEDGQGKEEDDDDDDDEEVVEIPVKLKVHDSLFVPLAKWPMLLTGNYRCARPGGASVPIERAVHGDLELSRRVYGWACDVCRRLGAGEDDLVPFEKYAAAAASLLKPSSAARALAGGAASIERVDALVLALAGQVGLGADEAVKETVATIDTQLEANAEAAAKAAPADA